MEKRYRKKQLSKEILQTISDFAGIFLSRQGVYKSFRAEVAVDTYRVDQALRRLRRSRYINTKDINNDEVIEITPQGRKLLLKYSYDDILIPTPKKWDKKWRIVIFDIPEKKRQVRNAINIKLKELGFIAIQKSTYIYPYECRKEIEFIKSHFYLKKEISYIVADEVDREEEFIRKFEL